MPRAILPEPPSELKQLSRTLCKKIEREIETGGFMPFSRYMEMVLYEPGLGYYSAGLHKLGRGGDFVTAPELGSLFAACLAVQVEEIASALGAYDIVELGAGSGRLAVELLRHLSAGRGPRRYLILERSADLQAVQKREIAERLPQWADRVHWLSRPPDEPWKGILLGNEVVDALAVERFRITPANIEQLGVGLNAGVFEWRSRSAPAAIRQAVCHLGLTGMAPYTSELNPYLRQWLDATAGFLRRGAALFIDYGYPRSEYYLPARREGTLMCHYRHNAHEDIFFWPGLQDISAWVDFTALAEAGAACGMEVAGYTSQALFLLGCGLTEIVSQRMERDTEGGVRLSAEARQLSLPGGMGERFQIMALTRGLNLAMRGFSLRDLRYRL